MTTTGSSQRLIADLEFLDGKLGTLAPGETRIVPHGLHETIGGSPRPVKPTSVLPDCSTPIVVTAADELTITVNNPTADILGTTFRVERVHTIHANPAFADNNAPIDPPFTMLLWQGSCGTGGGGASKSAVLCFATDDIGSDATTRYLEPWNAEGTADAVEVDPIVAPRDGTLQSLFARHDFANGNGNPVHYTVRINGVDTALTVALATGAVGQASNLVDTVPVLQGDRITLSVTKTQSCMNGLVLPHISMELV